MQNWQKYRNYRKYTNDDGSTRYIITVDGEDIEVSFEVYKAYSQADRRERYLVEREEGLLLSLERMAEKGIQFSYPASFHAESYEDIALRNILLGQIKSIFPLLEESERELINQLYFGGVSIRKYAKDKGLSDFAIRYRESKILAKIKNLLKN